MVLLDEKEVIDLSQENDSRNNPDEDDDEKLYIHNLKTKRICKKFILSWFLQEQAPNLMYHKCNEPGQSGGVEDTEQSPFPGMGQAKAG